MEPSRKMFGRGELLGNHALLTELTPGAKVQLRVVAASFGGEAVPSEPAQAQVPGALAA